MIKIISFLVYKAKKMNAFQSLISSSDFNKILKKQLHEDMCSQILIEQKRQKSFLKPCRFLMRKKLNKHLMKWHSFLETELSVGLRFYDRIHKNLKYKMESRL